MRWREIQGKRHRDRQSETERGERKLRTLYRDRQSETERGETKLRTLLHKDYDCRQFSILTIRFC